MSDTVLITGASRGIGAAAARLFAEAGYSVAVHCHQNRAAAGRLCAELTAAGCDADVFSADVSDPCQVSAMAGAVLRRFGRLDVLVNNAGIAQQKLLCDITDGDFRRMFAVHVDGMFYCCRALLPHMLTRGSGSIVNVSSVWGLCGASCEVHYSAAKAAVIGFTKALAKEVGPSGIRVNCVAPGVIDTDMNTDLDGETEKELAEQTPLGRIGTPREAAEAILFLAGGSAGFITGQVLSPNGGFVI